MLSLHALAFSASRQASRSEVDQRLEYLFWRIWGSDELLGRINLKYLNGLVSHILSSSSTSTKQARVSSSPPWTFFSLTFHQPQKIPSLPRAIAPSAAGHSHSKSHPTAGHSLHPILKKPATAPSETQKSTRLLLERPEGGKITCNPSTPPTPTPASSKDHIKHTPAARPTQKKNHSAAMRTSRGNRRRPVFNRRKSSQPSIQYQPSLPRAIETRGNERPDRRARSTDLDSESSKPESEAGNVHEDSESDIVPFPIEISSPPAQQPSNNVTLADSTLVTDLTDSAIKASVTVTVTPTALPISETQQKIETVSQDPMPQDKGKQRAETMDSSSESEDPDQVVEGTDVPGFPGAKRIPMPQKMQKHLLRLLKEARNPEDTNQKILLPNGPSTSTNRAWLPVYPQTYLEDWMLQGETSSSSPQPSNNPLVAPGFRKRFAERLEEDMEAWRKEEEALKALEGVTVADSERI